MGWDMFMVSKTPKKNRGNIIWDDHHCSHSEQWGNNLGWSSDCFFFFYGIKRWTKFTEFLVLQHSQIHNTVSMVFFVVLLGGKDTGESATKYVTDHPRFHEIPESLLGFCHGIIWSWWFPKLQKKNKISSKKWKIVGECEMLFTIDGDWRDYCSI